VKKAVLADFAVLVKKKKKKRTNKQRIEKRLGKHAKALKEQLPRNDRK